MIPNHRERIEELERRESAIWDLLPKATLSDHSLVQAVALTIRDIRIELAQLREAADGLAEFADHSGFCSMLAHDTCDCGYNEALAAYDKTKGVEET